MGIMGDSLRWKFMFRCVYKGTKVGEVSTNPSCPFCGCVCERYLYDGCSMCYRCVICLQSPRQTCVGDVFNLGLGSAWMCLEGVRC
jgi:hypothetical protein